jgi:hypothetical protein
MDERRHKIFVTNTKASQEERKMKRDEMKKEKT